MVCSASFPLPLCTHTDRHKQRQIEIHTDTGRHKYTNTCTYARSHAHTHTHTHTRTHTHEQVEMLSLCQSLEVISLESNPVLVHAQRAHYIVTVRVCFCLLKACDMVFDLFLLFLLFPFSQSHTITHTQHTHPPSLSPSLSLTCYLMLS